MTQPEHPVHLGTPCFIRPCSPLVFRSGMPFGQANQGGGQHGHDFPPLSSVAGALRAAMADGHGHLVKFHDDRMQALHVHGGLLAHRGPNGTVTLHAPKPADAIYGPKLNGAPRAFALRPHDAQTLQGAGTDLPHGLFPLQVPDDVWPEAMPGPVFWRWESWCQWMTQGRGPLKGGTAPGPAKDLRHHVAMSATTRAAIDGALFQSTGLDFDAQGHETGLLAWVQAHALRRKGSVVASPWSTDVLQGRSVRLGADGGAAHLQLMEPQHLPHLAVPRDLSGQLDALQVGACIRLALLTPACYYGNGWYPDGFLHHSNGCLEGKPKALQNSHWRFRIQAAAVDSWQVLTASNTLAGHDPQSGMGRPGFSRRPMRRLVPAGSVYWLKILEVDPDVPLSTLWFRSTCLPEYARDGHGLALPGLAQL
jgi:CRISPR-associated protein Cmr3